MAGRAAQPPRGGTYDAHSPESGPEQDPGWGARAGAACRPPMDDQYGRPIGIWDRARVPIERDRRRRGRSAAESSGQIRAPQSPRLCLADLLRNRRSWASRVVQRGSWGGEYFEDLPDSRGTTEPRRCSLIRIQRQWGPPRRGTQCPPRHSSWEVRSPVIRTSRRAVLPWITHRTVRALRGLTPAEHLRLPGWAMGRSFLAPSAEGVIKALRSFPDLTGAPAVGFCPPAWPDGGPPLVPPFGRGSMESIDFANLPPRMGLRLLLLRGLILGTVTPSSNGAGGWSQSRHRSWPSPISGSSGSSGSSGKVSRRGRPVCRGACNGRYRVLPCRHTFTAPLSEEGPMRVRREAPFVVRFRPRPTVFPA